MTPYLDLADDLVELAPCPAAPSGAPLREMAFRANAWLPDEDAFLRDLFWSDAPIAEIAERVGRRFQATRNRICELGLRRNSTRPWIQEEDAELIARYGSEPASAIALTLGRSVAAVYVRAQLLALTEEGAADYDAWEDAQIRAGYAAAVPAGQIATLIGRTVIGVRCRASALGVRHPHQPPNWSDEEATRALELASQGHRYLAIIETLADEGFPRRTKAGLTPVLHRLGYGRGWGRRWLPEEDEMLRRAYATGATLTPLRQRMGRTACSIRWRVKELGLQGTHEKKDGWRGAIWTAADEALLRAEFGKTASPELARKLGRTKAAMFSRANALGLQHGYIRMFAPDERRAIGIVWRLGMPLAMLAEALGRDCAVISKHAIRIGIPFNSPERPVQPTRGRKPARAKLSLAEILDLLPPDPDFDDALETRAQAIEARASNNRSAGASRRAAAYRERMGIAA